MFGGTGGAASAYTCGGRDGEGNEGDSDGGECAHGSERAHIELGFILFGDWLFGNRNDTGYGTTFCLGPAKNKILGRGSFAVWHNSGTSMIILVKNLPLV